MEYLDKMIASEKVPGAYEEWKKYREEVTDFIEDAFCWQGVSDEKPILAIWGVGQSNDMDLLRLSKKFQLVLIDRDSESVRDAVVKYDLKDGEYICANIPFWDVPYDIYDMFEAMLADAEDTEHIVEFLEKVAFDNSHKLALDTAGHFDYSVCAGVHSQLNARFAGLTFAYKENNSDEDLKIIENAVKALNEAAVTRLNDIIYLATNKKMIFGFEIAVVDETGVHEENIEGAYQMRCDIGLHKDFDISVERRSEIFWPFLWEQKKKGYMMEFVLLKKIP